LILWRVKIMYIHNQDVLSHSKTSWDDHHVTQGNGGPGIGQ